ncbi:MAG: alpha/beta hydrolase [Dermatophilaceae bacterium]
MPTDAVLLDGPWEHRFIAANGARFHLVEAGAGRPVLLVHGYPGFWWTWRAVLPALAAAGHRAIAVDVRGFGGSDKPPSGYDLTTAAADLAGLIRSLGEEQATVVGHGLGAWTVRHLGVFAPAVVSAVGLVSMPAPGRLGPYAAPLPRAQLRHYLRGLRMTTPRDPGGADVSSGEVERVLRTGSGPDRRWLTAEVVERHTDALAQPFVAHATSESFDRLRPSSRERRQIAQRIALTPRVFVAHGARDPFVGLAEALRVTRDAQGPLRVEIIPEAGHFVPDEVPGALSTALIEWLR